MKQFLETAKIVATHGIRGEMRCQYYCDSAEFLCEFDELYLDKNGEKQYLRFISTLPVSGGQINITFFMSLLYHNHADFYE